jgi:hypothetical protein
MIRTAWALIIIFLVPILGCSVAMYSTKFREASVSGIIKTGMTKEEVRLVLGPPMAVQARQTAIDLREVWTYKDRDYGRKVYGSDAAEYSEWVVLSIVSLGIGAVLLPPPASTHYVVFTDDKVLGWDLPDPFAPDLIIEKRER